MYIISLLLQSESRTVVVSLAPYNMFMAKRWLLGSATLHFKKCLLCYSAMLLNLVYYAIELSLLLHVMLIDENKLEIITKHYKSVVVRGQSVIVGVSLILHGHVCLYRVHKWPYNHHEFIIIA